MESLRISFPKQGTEYVVSPLNHPTKSSLSKKSATLRWPAYSLISFRHIGHLLYHYLELREKRHLEMARFLLESMLLSDVTKPNVVDLSLRYDQLLFIVLLGEVKTLT